MADWNWLLWPMIAGLLMSVALVPLGQRVLERNVVFADLAIAQWAALGAISGGRWLQGDWSFLAPVSALVFALAAVLLVHGVIRFATARREAMIGLLYVVGACTATLMVSDDPHGAQRLHEAFNGDLLWVTGPSLLPLAVIAGLVLLWRSVLRGSAQERTFLPLFALAVTLSVDQAGIYVVFASLIATPLLVGGRQAWATAAAVALCFAGYVLGLLLSARVDLPAGPTIVLCILACGLMAVAFLRPPAPTRVSPSPADRSPPPDGEYRAPGGS